MNAPDSRRETKGRHRHHIDRRACSTASASLIYAMLLDRSSWPSWSPLEAFEHEHDGVDGPQSLGAIGTFVSGRTRSREELIELVPDQRLSYRLLSGLPLTNYRADVDLRPIDGGTEIRWHSTFEARYGTGWAFRFGLGRFIAKTVEGLAAESSRRVRVAPISSRR